MKKTIGIWGAWALGVGTMIGNGIFMLPAVLAPYGSTSLFGWVFAGLGTLSLAIVFGNLAKRLPLLGGPYAYARHGLGDLTGFLVGWGLWISMWTGLAAGSLAFVGYFSVFFPILRNSQNHAGIYISIVFIWLITFINISGVKNASKFQLISTILKLIPLILIAGAGMYMGEVATLPPSNPNNEPIILLIASMVMVTMWAFLGIETTTIPASDIIEPNKTIPKALILAALTTTGIYIFATFGVMALVPMSELKSSTAPFADAASVVFGEYGGIIIAIGAIISISGSLNGVVMATGQLPKALAIDGLFPQIFAKSNQAGTPKFALLFSSTLASVLVIFNFSKGLMQAFEFVILVSTLTALLPFALSVLSELVLQHKDKRSGKKINIQKQVITLAAFGFSVFMVIGSGAEVVISGISLLLIGLPIFFWQRNQKFKKSITT